MLRRFVLNYLTGLRGMVNRFAVESLTGLPWNPSPLSRGILHRIAVEYTVRDIFQIPTEHEAVMSVIIGYPKHKYKQTIKRKVQTINWIN